MAYGNEEVGEGELRITMVTRDKQIRQCSRYYRLSNVSQFTVKTMYFFPCIKCVSNHHVEVSWNKNSK